MVTRSGHVIQLVLVPSAMHVDQCLTVRPHHSPVFIVYTDLNSLSDGPRSINARLVHNILECSADSNPSSEYQWIQISPEGEQTSVNGSEFDICSLNAFQESATNLEERVSFYTFQCVVNRGQHSTSTNLNFTLTLPLDARKRCGILKYFVSFLPLTQKW